MANSIRHQVMDAVITALEGVATLKLVSETLEDHEQIPKANLPAAFPIDGDEKREYAQIIGSSSIDVEAEMELIVSCVVYDRGNVTRQQRTDLMRLVEKALLNDSALLALILFIEPTGVVTDKGTIPNFSIWDQSYKVTYRYNSVDGG